MHGCGCWIGIGVAATRRRDPVLYRRFDDDVRVYDLGAKTDGVFGRGGTGGRWRAGCVTGYRRDIGRRFDGVADAAPRQGDLTRQPRGAIARI